MTQEEFEERIKTGNFRDKNRGYMGSDRTLLELGNELVGHGYSYEDAIAFVGDCVEEGVGYEYSGYPRSE